MGLCRPLQEEEEEEEGGRVSLVFCLILCMACVDCFVFVCFVRCVSLVASSPADNMCMCVCVYICSSSADMCICVCTHTYIHTHTHTHRSCILSL